MITSPTSNRPETELLPSCNVSSWSFESLSIVTGVWLTDDLKHGGATLHGRFRRSALGGASRAVGSPAGLDLVFAYLDSPPASSAACPSALTGAPPPPCFWADRPSSAVGRDEAAGMRSLRGSCVALFSNSISRRRNAIASWTTSNKSLCSLVASGKRASKAHPIVLMAGTSRETNESGSIVTWTARRRPAQLFVTLNSGAVSLRWHHGEPPRLRH